MDNQKRDAPQNAPHQNKKPRKTLGKVMELRGFEPLRSHCTHIFLNGQHAQKNEENKQITAFLRCSVAMAAFGQNVKNRTYRAQMRHKKRHILRKDGRAMVTTGEQVKERPVVLTPHELLDVMEGRNVRIVRVMRPQPQEAGGYSGHKNDIKWDVEPGIGVHSDEDCAKYLTAQRVCPYGQPGERLWVKEKLFVSGDINNIDDVRWVCAAECDDPDLTARCMKTVQPQYMPRWASRFTLEVVATRAVRVDSITKKEALEHNITTDKYDANLWVWLVDATPTPKEGA